MTAQPQNAPQILSLLVSSPLGLTPSGVVELGQEAGWLSCDGRASYQQVLRTLKSLHRKKLLSRSGKRYLIPPGALAERYQAEASHWVSKAITHSRLPADAEAWTTAFQTAVGSSIGSDNPGPPPPGG